MGLTDKQITALLAPLDAGRVREVRGNAHLEAWDDRRWLLRIFGWGGYDIETLECALVSERSVWDDNNPLKGRHSVVYRVRKRLIIKDADGRTLAFFDDGATGDAQNQPSLGDAHDQALKTAMSQALKRCCVNLGDQFGLSLYNGGRTMPVVGRSIAHDLDSGADTQESVEHGEMAEVPSTVQSMPETSAASAAPPPEPSPESLSPLSESDREAALRTTVDTLRERVLTAMQERSRNKALQLLTRIGLDASQAGVQQQMTTSPAGEPMTVSVLLDSAIRLKSRAEAADA